MEEGKVLVLGATGTVGRPLVRALLAKGVAVKAASRAGAAVEGAEGVVFDHADPATFEAAFEGVDRVYMLLPAGRLDVVGELGAVIAAAQARGAKVVMQSVFGADADDAIPYRQIELALGRSGLAHVILRPNWFADNFVTYWKWQIDQGRISVPAAAGKVSFVDVRDIADSAAAALASDRFDGKAFNLTGPAAVGYAEAAALIAEAIGRPVAYEPVDDAALVADLTGVGVARDYAEFLAAIFYPVREGWAAAVTGDVETLTGHAPRSLQTWVRDNAAALGATAVPA